MESKMSTHSYCVIVLGCTVMPDGSPSDWLCDRLEAAQSLIQGVVLNYSVPHPPASNVALHIYLTGGAVRSEITEASCMRAWLMRRLVDMFGYPDSTTTNTLRVSLPETVVTILLHEEDSAQDTLDNMTHTVRMILAEEPVNPRRHLHDVYRSRIALVTSDFHLRRGITLLKRELSHQLGLRSDSDIEEVLFHSGGDRGSNDAVTLLAELSSPQLLVVGIGSPTPTLFGDALAARKAREIMLTESDSARQLQIHNSVGTFN